MGLTREEKIIYSEDGESTDEERMEKMLKDNQEEFDKLLSEL